MRSLRLHIAYLKLVISDSIHLRHGGHYYIYAGPPTAVITKCKIQDDNVSISITWKQPASNGAEITWYKVYQRRRNEEDWMEIRTIKNTSSLEFVVKELEKGKEYQFLITARNTHGESLRNGYCKPVLVPGGRYCIALYY